jgi:hypothetical protein
VLDAADVASRIELMLPTGGRPRQLPVRTLLLGMIATQADGRPAQLTRVHTALVNLDEADQRRLGILIDWASGPHQLTYRQVERTFGLIVDAVAKPSPDGQPSPVLSELLDDLLEASIPDTHQQTSPDLAVDWTDLDSFGRPPVEPGRPSADPEASWGHRRGNGPGHKDELFYGYYLQAATMVCRETGPEIPELVRRIHLSSCHLDPPTAFVTVLTRLPEHGIPLGDILADSGYAHRAAANWAAPLRAAGAALVQDLHPHDRGPKGTHAGAIIANGNLYCPATPRPLLDLTPLPRAATTEQTTTHDTQTSEAARYKLGRISTNDADGYHRVGCPATLGKLRCPHRPTTMALPLTRPEILTPPDPKPLCCTQQTITVPAAVTAKTAQKHDYPSQAHRRSYRRRSAAERSFSTVKDPASNDITRGWCRLTGLTALALFTGCLFVVRNDRILTAFNHRQADTARRHAAGLPPRTRRRRRRTLAELATPANAPP